MAKDIRKFGHPAYLAALPDYIQIRDCLNGARAIKEAGSTYLPVLKGQSSEDYANYLNRALFFPVTAKTSSTIVGMATARPPTTTYPEDLAQYFKDADPGRQFTETFMQIFSEVVPMGRFGILIDAPTSGDPNLCPYLAENIINWEVNEQGIPTMLLLREFKIEKGDDKFESKTVTRFRHCYLLNGIYTVELLDDDLGAVGPPIQPTFTGSTIDFIPFVPFGATGVHMHVDAPPMRDISTINISHYMTSADLEWGRHIAGLPTPVVSGVDVGTALHIGGTKAWMLPDSGAKAYYMEFQGQGLQSLEKAMAEKIGLMASMSARMIDNSTRGSEAPETVRLRYMSESASILHIINSVEVGVNQVYGMLAKLAKSAGTVTVQFSREIMGLNLKFSDLKTLFEGFLQGALSKETLVYNLRRLEAIDPNRTDAEELAAIKKPEPPSQKLNQPTN